jgi:SAM-dependent methyltransferase
VGNVPLDFTVADARHLPYANESFELILEKGTLDAMLSENNQQAMDDCALIVSECARVLKTGGYFMIISHLNAHTPQGMEWLQNVVFQGLQRQKLNSSSDDDDDGDDQTTTTTAAASWEMEVHGNDPAVGEDGTPCPAVYIMHKLLGSTTIASTVTTADEGESQMEEEEEDPPTIPVKFFGY